MMRPQSIAIVGASPERRSIASVVLENLQRFNYTGAVHLVSRSRSEIDGIVCVPAISDLPDTIDVAVLCIPQSATAEAVAQCSDKGVAGVIVFASGYAEAGADGRAEQARLLELAQQRNVLILGPNCMGMANLIDGIPLSFTEFAPNVEPSPDGVAVLAQSGAMMGNIAGALQAKNVPVSYAYSTGNEAVLSTEDLFEFVIDDKKSRVVAIFAEQLRNPQRFLHLAQRAQEHGMRVVLFHSGRSDKARLSAASHTGSIAGNFAVMEVAVRNVGVVLVSSFEELNDVATILYRYPVAEPRNGLALLTNSGAFGGFAIDFCDALGLKMADTTAETRERLRSLLPTYVSIDQFVDLGTAGRAKPTIYGDCASALLDDPEVDSVLVSMVGGSPASQLSKANSLLPQVTDARKRLVLVFLGDEAPLDSGFLELVRMSRLPFFRSAERVLRAFAAIAKVERLDRRVCPLPARAESIALPSGHLTEFDAKKVLSDFGIAVPAGALCESLVDAQSTARRLGYPVVLKAQSSDLLHKTDVGAVKINIRSSAELDQAWQHIEDNLRKVMPVEKLQGMLVEEMIPHQLELVVGGRRDPDWGPILVIGIGGIWVEALNDVRLLPADATEDRIVDELSQLRSASLLDGARGSQAVNKRALASLIMKLGAAVRGFPELSEVDLNPVVPTTEGFIALDALIVVDN